MPEGQSFEGRAVRDKAESVPADYRAPQASPIKPYEYLGLIKAIGYRFVEPISR